MHADMFVVRHSESGAPYLIAQHCAPHVHVVNAGDGRHAHPTQGLLDMYTIRHFKKDFHQPDGRRDGRRHPAFARRALGHPCAHHARRAGDPCRRPEDAGAGRPAPRWACGCATTWPKASADADVIIMLRLQSERMSGALLPSFGRVLQELRAHAGEARARQARLHRDAPGPHQPRGWRSTRPWPTASRA